MLFLFHIGGLSTDTNFFNKFNYTLLKICKWACHQQRIHLTKGTLYDIGWQLCCACVLMCIWLGLCPSQHVGRLWCSYLCISVYYWLCFEVSSSSGSNLFWCSLDFLYGFRKWFIFKQELIRNQYDEPIV